MIKGKEEKVISELERIIAILKDGKHGVDRFLQEESEDCMNEFIEIKLLIRRPLYKEKFHD